MSELYKVILKTDGDQWCAHLHNFEDLQEDIAGFGDSRWQAVKELFFRLSDNESRAAENSYKVKEWHGS